MLDLGLRGSDERLWETCTTRVAMSEPPLPLPLFLSGCHLVEEEAATKNRTFPPRESNGGRRCPFSWQCPDLQKHRSLEGQAGNCFVSCRACVRAVPM